MNDIFFKSFSKRSVIIFFIISVLFFYSILRLSVMVQTDYSAVSGNKNILRIKAGEIRGTIYDCNMIPLTNKDKKIIAAVSPTPRAITAISRVLKGEKLNDVLTLLKSGKPAVCEVDEIQDCDGISCTEVYVHNTKDMPAVHLIGYVGSDGHGVSGIEKAYDNILYSEKDVSFVYSLKGNGKILDGVSAEIERDDSEIAGGVITTIDVNIQAVAEKAAENIETGTVIIADSRSSEIKAMVSKPWFDANEPYKYLNSDNSPFLNRAVSAYNVGSVFKPCVAAAGIESGKENFIYNCKGNCVIEDRTFNCHKRDGHGLMNLKDAVANSCNTFFYNFAIKIGGEAIFNTAARLNFGSDFEICDGISVSGGNLTDKNTLKNVSALANFSIGQGDLTVSPITMLNLYSAIATDGGYFLPTVIKGTVKDGKVTKAEKSGKTKAMNQSTAKKLRECLKKVVTDGTGKSAKPLLTDAAGKTATAQTGKFENGKEICEGWFCGFFPADNPRYTVIVFSENIEKQEISCAEIFAHIADEITDGNY